MKTKSIPTLLITLVCLLLFSCEDDLLNMDLPFDQAVENSLPESETAQEVNNQIGSAARGALDNAGGLDGDSSTFY